MESSKDHIATLAAAGTLGLAIAGLALGTEGETVLVNPGKRKSPGADVSYFPNTLSTSSSAPPRRTVSQPTTLASTPEQTTLPRLSTSLFRRKTLRDPEQASTNGSLYTESRGSSSSRYGRQIPSTTLRDGSTDRDDSRPRSSWLKRISSIHSTQASSPAPSFIMKAESDLQSHKHRIDVAEMPNKLVKRSTSHRVLSNTEPKGSFFRRPATSHRRSASQIPTSTPLQLTPASVLSQMTPPLSTLAPSWRPYFETGYPRKRHTSETAREGAVRTVSVPYLRRPTLVNARTVDRQDKQDDVDESRPISSPSESGTAHRRPRLKYSFGTFRKYGRQRNFTDPVVRVSREDAEGSILPSTKQSPLSPMSRSSTFNLDLPHGTPALTSSPPIPQHHRVSVNKRVSAAQSDLNTTSSDNDTRVFTDDESMDFQSDTAYDSLATRATVSSHSGFRQPKIETIFDKPVVEHGDRHGANLEELMQRSTLNDLRQDHTPMWAEAVGMGISGLSHDKTEVDYAGPRATTPIRSSVLTSIEELNATPVALNHRARVIDIPSSSPPSVLRHPMSPSRMPKVQYPEDMDLDGEDSIDWSPTSDQNSATEDTYQTRRKRRATSPHGHASNQRPSIFDWSEQQMEASNGLIPRPKTVHGKHANDAGRSRASGRKSSNTAHLRSQSVPVNRDTTVDAEATPSAAAKFSTWGLGNKPVSEEWSDDFVFDDNEDLKETAAIQPEVRSSLHDSVRSMKVPQNILDRQASVRLQFGQVQEFMMLVEELRRLRARGTALTLLDGPSWPLWEDAETIINLATLNDEEEALVRPHSPGSSDIFGEENSPSSRRISHEEKQEAMPRRSISNPATPPFARPRGESLLHARSFLQAMQQSRFGSGLPMIPSSPRSREKKNFDTQDLRDLVTRAGVITRSLKEIVRKAEGVAVSPQRTPQKVHDPTFSHIFNPPDAPPPMFRKPGLPKSRSANSYLGSSVGSSENEIPPPLKFAAVIEAN